MKLHVINLLFNLFQEQGEQTNLNYESIDSFYALLGYELESEQLLEDLKINGTSDLLELLTDYDSFLDGEITEEAFCNKWA